MLARRRARHRGVIDTLSAGYAVVNRQPWLLLAPILLDLLLWLGPRVSAAALVAQALSAPSLMDGLDDASRAMLADSSQNLRELASDFNVLALLAPARVGIPSMLAVVGGGGLAGDQMLRSWGAATVVMLSTLASGLVLGGLFRAALAQQARGEPVQITPLAREALLGAWRTALLLLLLLLAALAIPVALAAGILTVFAPPLAGLVLMLAGGFVLWAEVFLFFAPDAIYVSHSGPLQALRNSVGVVRRAFWPAVGLVILVTLILAGMSQIWLLLSTRGPAGMVLAIVGNAYIATGLAAASMLFYRERLADAASSDEASAVR